METVQKRNNVVDVDLTTDNEADRSVQSLVSQNAS